MRVNCGNVVRAVRQTSLCRSVDRASCRAVFFAGMES